MKRLLSIISVLAIILIFFSPQCAASDVSSLAEDYGIGETADKLPYSAAEFLEENGISPDDPEGVMSLSPKTVIEYTVEKFKHSAAMPLKIFGSIISVIILSAAVSAAADTGGGGTKQVCRVISVLTAVAVTIPYVGSCLEDAADTLEKGSDFMLCYVPVFAGIAAAAGNAAASAGYNAAVLIIAEIAVTVTSQVLMPAVSVCMAMNIIEAVNPALKLSAVTGLLKKWSSLLMGFIMTVFTGFLSLQSIVGVSADTVGVKAAKFMMSNLVPVVGGAVADAYSTMRSGLGLLRGAAGAFGVIALTVTLLPPILETCCMYLAMTAGTAVSELLGINELGVFFRGAASVFSLVSAILACFCVMFVISTIILMAAGLGAAGA